MRMRHPLNMTWTYYTENVIQSSSYLWKMILVSVRYSPTSRGEYRTSDGANADKKRSWLKCTAQCGPHLSNRLNDLIWHWRCSLTCYQAYQVGFLRLMTKTCQLSRNSCNYSPVRNITRFSPNEMVNLLSPKLDEILGAILHIILLSEGGRGWACSFFFSL